MRIFLTWDDNQWYSSNTFTTNFFCMLLCSLSSTKNLLVLLFASIAFVSCSDDPEKEEVSPREVDDTNARFVIEGTPWGFDRYELFEVRERNGSSLTEEELVGLISDDFWDVVIEFMDMSCTVHHR